jgi:hypothetical protein
VDPSGHHMALLVLANGVVGFSTPPKMCLTVVWVFTYATKNVSNRGVGFHFTYKYDMENLKLFDSKFKIKCHSN